MSLARGRAMRAGVNKMGFCRRARVSTPVVCVLGKGEIRGQTLGESNK